MDTFKHSEGKVKQDILDNNAKPAKPVISSSKQEKCYPSVTSPTSHFLKPQDVADRLGVSKKTVIEWCKTGKLPAVPRAYGKRVTYLVGQSALELIQTTKPQGRLDKRKHQVVEHKSLVRPWLKALRTGAFNGKVFSERTIETYIDRINRYFEAHTIVSLKNIKKCLMHIPPESYAKKDKTYKALVCSAKFLKQNDLIEKTLIDDLKELRPKRHLPIKRPTVVETDLNAILASELETQERALVLLLANTGLRASEACNLSVEHLNLVEGWLLVEKGKGGKSRKVGLNKTTVEAVTTWLEERSRVCKTSPLFIDKNNKRMTRHGVHARLEKLGNRLGIHVTPHALRRTFVTINANKGRSLVILQRGCGHSDIRTTMTYCRTSENEVIEAMKGW